MKNHEWIDGKLLQTNKKYSHLKQKQKDKIYEWMYAKMGFRERGMSKSVWGGEAWHEMDIMLNW